MNMESCSRRLLLGVLPQYTVPSSITGIGKHTFRRSVKSSLDDLVIGMQTNNSLTVLHQCFQYSSEISHRYLSIQSNILAGKQACFSMMPFLKVCGHWMNWSYQIFHWVKDCLTKFKPPSMTSNLSPNHYIA